MKVRGQLRAAVYVSKLPDEDWPQGVDRHDGVQFENIAERFTDKAAEKRPVVEGADQPSKMGSRLRTGGALNIGGDSGRKRSRPSGAGEEDDDDTIPLSQQFRMNLPGQEETASASPTRSRPQEAARPQQTGQQPPTQRSQQGPPPAARQERTTTGATPTSAGMAARPRSSSVAPGREPPRTTEAVSTPTAQGVPPPQRHEPTPPVQQTQGQGSSGGGSKTGRRFGARFTQSSV